MILEDALKSSPVYAAYRPWELVPENVPEDQRKFIVVKGEFDDVYVVNASSFDYIRQFDPIESYKLSGRSDWVPVGIKGE